MALKVSVTFFVQLHYILTTRQEISYQVRYAEENHRSPDRPWSVRQTGVYHHHSAKNDFDLFILLHPTENSPFERQLISLATMKSSQGELASLIESPYRLHIMPFALYIDDWRWYVRYLGEEFQDKVPYTLVSHLKLVLKTMPERRDYDGGYQNLGDDKFEL